MLSKALEAEQIVNFKTPSSGIKTTNLERLEPMRSSSASSNEKTVGINEEKIEEKNQEPEKELDEPVKTFHETERPFQRGGIIVHKLHPIESISLN